MRPHLGGDRELICRKSERLSFRGYEEAILNHVFGHVGCFRSFYIIVIPKIHNGRIKISYLQK